MVGTGALPHGEPGLQAPAHQEHSTEEDELHDRERGGARQVEQLGGPPIDLDLEGHRRRAAEHEHDAE